MVCVSDPELPGWAKGDVASYVPHIFTPEEHLQLRLALFDTERYAALLFHTLGGHHVLSSFPEWFGDRPPFRSSLDGHIYGAIITLLRGVIMVL